MLIDKINNLIISKSSSRQVMKAIFKYLIKKNIKYVIKSDGIYFQLNRLSIDQLYDIEDIINEHTISYTIIFNE
jgi:hypothetical protein